MCVRSLRTNTRSGYYETVSSVEIQGKSLSIGEISQYKIYNSDDIYNELASQHRLPPREFVVLTNNGIHLLVCIFHSI